MVSRRFAEYSEDCSIFHIHLNTRAHVITPLVQALSPSEHTTYSPVHHKAERRGGIFFPPNYVKVLPSTFHLKKISTSSIPLHLHHLSHQHLSLGSHNTFISSRALILHSLSNFAVKIALASLHRLCKLPAILQLSWIGTSLLSPLSATCH